MPDIFHALVLDMHQPWGNLLLYANSGKKEIVFDYDRMGAGCNADLA